MPVRNAAMASASAIENVRNTCVAIRLANASRYAPNTQIFLKVCGLMLPRLLAVDVAVKGDKVV